jgi:hypothetical protein
MLLDTNPNQADHARVQKIDSYQLKFTPNRVSEVPANPPGCDPGAEEQQANKDWTPAARGRRLQRPLEEEDRFPAAIALPPAPGGG